VGISPKGPALVYVPLLCGILYGNVATGTGGSMTVSIRQYSSVPCILYRTHGDVIRLVVSRLTVPSPSSHLALPRFTPLTPFHPPSPLPSFRPGTPAPRPANMNIPGGRLSRPGDLVPLESSQQVDVSACLGAGVRREEIGHGHHIPRLHGHGQLRGHTEKG
jgi:hypothetical protein